MIFFFRETRNRVPPGGSPICSTRLVLFCFVLFCCFLLLFFFLFVFFFFFFFFCFFFVLFCFCFCFFSVNIMTREKVSNATVMSYK